MSARSIDSIGGTITSPTNNTALPVSQTLDQGLQNTTEKTSDTVAAPIVLEHEQLEASFEYDQHLRQVIIKLKRADDGEVIRQLPPEQVVNMLNNIVNAVESMFDVKG
ncbi:MAG TPA: flagellar protein FlaG [Armatimonadota bacterium]|nr:flagellar protein FlaG [Armatimonadota bacterium]